jgi:hypothetical protein
MSLVLSSFAEGIKVVWQNKSLVGIAFIFKFAFSFVLLLPFYMMFSASFGRNVKAINFLEQPDISLLVDFIYHWRKILPIYFVIFFFLCGIGMLVFIFLSGGWWGVLRDKIRGLKEVFSMERYFGYCGKYFWAFFKLSLVLLVLYLAVLLVYMLFSSVFDSAVGESNLLEITSWRVLIKLFVGLILFFFVNMTGDYLRIFLIENQGERFFALLRRGISFVLTNFVFLIQQTFVLFTSFYRLIYYSSQLSLYERIYRAANSIA